MALEPFPYAESLVTAQADNVTRRVRQRHDVAVMRLDTVHARSCIVTKHFVNTNIVPTAMLYLS